MTRITHTTVHYYWTQASIDRIYTAMWMDRKIDEPFSSFILWVSFIFTAWKIDIELEPVAHLKKNVLSKNIPQPLYWRESRARHLKPTVSVEELESKRNKIPKTHRLIHCKENEEIHCDSFICCAADYSHWLTMCHTVNQLRPLWYQMIWLDQSYGSMVTFVITLYCKKCSNKKRRKIFVFIL